MGPKKIWLSHGWGLCECKWECRGRECGPGLHEGRWLCKGGLCERRQLYEVRRGHMCSTWEWCRDGCGDGHGLSCGMHTCICLRGDHIWFYMLTGLLATRIRVIVNTAAAAFHNADTVCIEFAFLWLCVAAFPFLGPLHTHLLCRLCPCVPIGC